ncbi:MAG: UDP-N-acetylmuramoyl-L-alanine--D-glutamate ligase [Gammaproteobacteria bacterium CG11_big_fil_rev_8_21_14_0_20_46_22]|nr:MAG: UDP-N-acetylmuramoyl-L-alanine--D-glutamate ligase [Gammaproteobacteria bacterium CG12_big_fil_rev_8_21_14_0_65_46_12]PIR10814.1 MAG: UDP-N-acetylmuramoyl-L-alanine--D-glutamate ligase [Gammaproteobacteria bacterium CG11_big_fil_rev_8_21_14_0_20_46_22]
MVDFCIVGLGVSGLAAAKYCLRQGYSFSITDSRDQPPGLETVQALSPNTPFFLGGFSLDAMLDANEVIVSPGVSLKEPALLEAKKQGKTLLGDLELFARVAKRPVVAITGSNGKTTVTSLIGEMARACGQRVVVAGNIGTSVLDSLAQETLPDLYVLELSSFQLERIESLKLRVAVFLNLCEDHMDRYDSLADYAAAKQRIYQHAQICVYNREDPWTTPPAGKQTVSFACDEPKEGEFGLIDHDDKTYLAKGTQRLMPSSRLFLEGRHHVANALACLAAGDALGLDIATMLDVLRKFRGIRHRCEWVRLMQGVTWYNDSKGTNVGATLAAIQTLGEKTKGKLILIAGGQGKGADFSPLRPLVKRYVREVILMGEVADQLERLFADVVKTVRVNSMDEAVQAAELAAVRGDSVLLSPACASFDMFNNYEHRGDVFCESVKAL